MRDKREISPALNISVDQYVSLVPESIRSIISVIRAEKESDLRPRPSQLLIDRSTMLTRGKRSALLDKVAELVDENVIGRSDMCLQFAALMNLALKHIGLSSNAVVGIATYFSPNGKRIFSWHHAWVWAGKEIIDGNTDSMGENPAVLHGIKADPYWGPIRDVSKRKYDQLGYVGEDPDVIGIWWPDSTPTLLIMILCSAASSVLNGPA